MIVRCDKCSTRFRLDDSKVTDAGVRVRCSKCRNVFTVYSEPHEEPDVDALFQGLHGQAPPVPSPVAVPQEIPVQEQPPKDDSPVASESDAWSDSSFAEESAEQDQTAAQFEVPEQDDSSPMSFDMPDDRVTLSVPAPQEELDTAPADDQWQGEAFVFEDTEAKAVIPQEEEFSGWKEEDVVSQEEFALPESVGFTADESDFDPLTEDLPTADTPVVSAPEPAPVTWQVMPEDEKAAPSDEDDFLFEDAVHKHEDEHFETPDLEFHFEEEEVASATAPSADDDGSEDSVFIFEDELAATAKQEEPAPKLDLFEEHETSAAGDSADAGLEPESQRREVSAAYNEFLAPTAAVDEPQEELPPLAIASRRQGNPVVALIMAVVALVVVIVLGVAGLVYFDDPGQLLAKIGLGSLVKKAAPAGDEGTLQVRGVQATYVHNATVGDLFVVKSEAVNNFPKPRAALQVRVKILGTKGEVLQQKTAFCGNGLSPEQLASMPLQQIEASMNNQFGDNLSNMGVAPGKAIPCVVAVAGVLPTATDFAVEAAGSTPATK